MLRRKSDKSLDNHYSEIRPQDKKLVSGKENNPPHPAIQPNFPQIKNSHLLGRSDETSHFGLSKEFIVQNGNNKFSFSILKGSSNFQNQSSAFDNFGQNFYAYNNKVVRNGEIIPSNGPKNMNFANNFDIEGSFAPQGSENKEKTKFRQIKFDKLREANTNFGMGTPCNT